MSIHITPEFRDTLITQLEDHLSDLRGGIIHGIESISPKTHKQSYDMVQGQIEQVQKSISQLKIST